MRFSTLLFFIFAIATVGFSQGNWASLPPDELAMKNPKVEPSADAEVLFWEVRLVDNIVPRAGFRSVLNHHLRIKIFTDRGREQFSKIDVFYGDYLSYSSRVRVEELAARTIKPDGSVLELSMNDVFDRDILRANRFRRRAKSFVVPGLETGAIIEYRWKEVREEPLNFSRIILAREIPVQYVRYFIKPANWPAGMRLHSINTSGDFVKEKDGFYSTTMRNVPAYVEEPDMTSEFNVIPWVLMYYGTDDENISNEDYWRNRAKRTFDAHKQTQRPSDSIRKAALQAIGDATGSMEKIRRVFEFCRKNLRDINDDAVFSNSDRESYRSNKSIDDVLERKIGTWHDLDLLFDSMLVSLGFDARFANVASKRDARFNRTLANDYFIRTEVVAVNVEGEWKFFDLSNRYLPFGMISSAIEGEAALVSGERDGIWSFIPVSASDQSKVKRSARVDLAPNGGISGSASIEFTGHQAAFYRELLDDESEPVREANVEKLVKGKIGNMTEVKNIIIENFSEPEKALIFKFQIVVPGYADQTSKRLFLRPNLFLRNALPRYPSATRQSDIVFEYPWSEDDEVIFTLPNGHVPDSIEVPKKYVDERQGLALDLSVNTSEPGLLKFSRSFKFGVKGALTIYDFRYSGLKAIFDKVYSSDTFSVALSVP